LKKGDEENMKRKTMSILVCFTLVITAFAIIPSNVSAATEDEIEQAIEDGIAYLITQQDAGGGWRDGWDNINPGVTGLVLIKLQDRAYELGLYPFQTDDTQPDYYEYADEVILGWQYLLSNFWKQFFSDAYGSDTNGNGWGISVSNSDYFTGISLMTLAATGDSSRPNDGNYDFDGDTVVDTYGEIIQEVVDWLSYAQVDSASTQRGGWGYGPNSGGDNSVTGYAVLGLAAA
jgi:hypothetical protein